MASRFNHRFLIICVASAGACVHGTSTAAYLRDRAADAPTVVRCFYGAVFGSGASWMVLDSISADSRSGWAQTFILDSADIRPAIYGAWQREGDTLAIHTTSMMATARWRLYHGPEGLSGRGWMIHDVGTRDSSGRFIPWTTLWPSIVLRARSCTTLPR
jgi:hypothetical protein